MLPMPSMSSLRPRPPITPANRSRAALSSAVPLSRQTPPSSVAPKRAKVAIRSCRSCRKMVSSGTRFHRPVHFHLAQLFKRPGYLQDAEIVAAMADHLDADRQMSRVECRADRCGGLSGLVEHRGENRMGKRNIAEHARLLGGKIHHRQNRRDHVIPALE